MTERLIEAIGKRTLLCDGAMGTQLQQAGLQPGECGEYWNILYPDRVEKIQRAYADAGSDVIITNTFGGCRLNLEKHGHGDEVAAINKASVQIARRAVAHKNGFVLGDVGPFGGLMEPYGTATEDQVRSALREQIEALMSEDVDGLIVETQTALEEAAIGVQECVRAGAKYIIVSFAFDVGRDGKSIFTMMGVSPEMAAEFAQSAGAHMVGINCGTNLDIAGAIEVTRRFRAVCDLPVIAQPNAGNPELDGANVRYLTTPEQMAQQVPELAASGARIIGACCGSSPLHISAMKAQLIAA
jgi:5-methyltetrahydrofolate--homocysteine methyltransferase